MLFQACTFSSAILVLIVFVSLCFALTPPMHRQPYSRPRRRRIEFAPRQAGSATTTVPLSTVPSTTVDGSSLPQANPAAAVSTSTTSSGSFSNSSSSSASSSSTSTSITDVVSTTTSSSSSSSSSGSISSSSSSSRVTSTSSSTSISTSEPISSTSSRKSPSRSPPQLAPQSSSTSTPITTTPITTEHLPLTAAPTPSVSGTNPTLATGPATTSSNIVAFDPSATNKPITASSRNGFLANKAAVAGTFTAVALVVLGIIVAIVFLKRKRRGSRLENDDEFWDTFTRQSMPETAQVPSNNSHSPSSSVAELAMYAPMDPYSGNQSYILPSHGPNYSQTAAHGFPPVPEHSASFLQPSPHQLQSSTAPRVVPPVQARQVAGRDSYQPSIDSFYGAA